MIGDFLFKGFWDWLSWLWTETVRMVTTLAVRGWAAFLIFVYLLWKLLSIPVKLVVLIVSLVGEIEPGDWSLDPGSVGNVLAITNTVFPLDEFCTLFSAYILLLIVMTIYRHLKTWIPAVCGT